MSELLKELRAALKGRFEIEKELGHRGRATVFIREIRIAAANLTHPHILPLYDSGDAESFLFYVMPYIAGQTLRDRIEKEGELPMARTVRIIREVVDALAFATIVRPSERTKSRAQE